MQFTVKRENREYGPYAVEQLKGFLERGNFVLTDLASVDGKNWAPISELPGFGEAEATSGGRSLPKRKPSIKASSQKPDEVPGIVVAKLAETQGWVRFFSILFFIGVGLLVWSGYMILSVVGSRGFLPSLINFSIALLYVFPGLQLSAYANRIASLQRTKSEVDLVAALEAQRSFWTFVGIVTAIVLGIYLVIFTLNFF